MLVRGPNGTIMMWVASGSVVKNLVVVLRSIFDKIGKKIYLF